MKPFFSIVIATYNFGRFLDDAIRSLLSQSCQDFELIVVDGGSTDSTLEIIRKYEDRIAWWVSEQDNGQSEAFNKGFSRANGIYLTWLNADDIMLPGALEAVKNKLKKTPNAGWVTGNFIRFRDSDKKIIQAEWGPHYVPTFLQGRHFPLMIFGPTTFWKKSIYDRIGGIDENLHYGMDTEYWWRLTVNGYKQIRVNKAVWAFRMHEGSKTAEFDDCKNSEEVKKKKNAEHNYTMKKHDVNVTWWGTLIIRVARIFDMSFLFRILRMKFIKGSYLNSIYDCM